MNREVCEAREKPVKRGLLSSLQKALFMDYKGLKKSRPKGKSSIDSSSSNLLDFMEFDKYRKTLFFYTRIIKVTSSVIVLL